MDNETVGVMLRSERHGLTLKIGRKNDPGAESKARRRQKAPRAEGKEERRRESRRAGERKGHLRRGKMNSRQRQERRPETGKAASGGAEQRAES